jgi:hypothetical protein
VRHARDMGVAAGNELEVLRQGPGDRDARGNLLVARGPGVIAID